MSEQNTQAAGQIQMMINTQYVKDLSFENPNAPQSLVPGQEQPQGQMNIDVGIKALQDNVHEVALNISVEAKAAGQVAYICELTYCGVFTIQGVPMDQQVQILAVEGPKNLFPFARAIIAEATTNGGFPPLLLTPIDFAALAQQRMMQEQANASGTNQMQ